MNYGNRPKRLQSPRRLRPKRLAFCGFASLALLAGCAGSVRVVSECPEPSPSEAQDLSDWLIELPERPAQEWAARVVGHIYPEDLATERGVEDETAGWMIWPLRRADE